MRNNQWTIGRVARQARCNIETIRFYEKESLLPAPARTEGGHRLYTPQMVERLTFIRRCRELGFTMNEIRELLSLVDGDQATCAPVKAIVDAHLQEIRNKIADLRRMESTLQRLSDECPGGAIPECPFIQSLHS